jgi:hypothetical protein
VTAQVIVHPAALARQIRDMRAAVADAEDWAGWLFDGLKQAGERFPELDGVYGAQDIAVEWADQIAADLRRELRALELQAEAQAAPTGSTK